MKINGRTTKRKQQETDSRYTYPNNPDIMRREEDGVEFSKLLNEEKVKLLNKKMTRKK
jgi:hypothetical protein